MKFYFKEIKNRFLIIIFSFFVTFAICFVYKINLSYICIKSGLLATHNTNFYLITTDPLELLVTLTRLCFFFSKFLGGIVLLYHSICFVSKGLYKKEFFYSKKVIKKIIFWSILNLIFFNSWLFPQLWTLCFFIQSHLSEQITVYFEPSFKYYIEFYLILLKYFFGFFVQLILMYYLLFFFKLKKRKIFYVLFIILATFLSTSELYSQLSLFFIFCVYFELSIFIIKFFKKK